MRRFRSRMSYANVTATLALFLALGGGAYAATSLPANSVGTKQLKDGAVTPRKLSGSALAFDRVLTGFSEADNGQGGSGITTNYEPVMSLNTGFASSGFIKVTEPVRLIWTAGLTWLGSGAGVNVHVDCVGSAARSGQAAAPAGTDDNGAGQNNENSVTLANTSEYRDLALTGSQSVGPGSYDVQILCANRNGGTGSGSFVRGNLTVIAAPQ